LTLKEAIKAVRIYQAIPMEFLDVDLEQAIQLCDKYKIYAYDAYMIACSKASHAPLLTLDRELIDVAHKAKIKLWEV